MCSLFLPALTKTGKARLILTNTSNIKFHQNLYRCPDTMTSGWAIGDNIRTAKLTSHLYNFYWHKCRKWTLNGRYGSYHVTSSYREHTQSKTISDPVMWLTLQNKILYALTRRDIAGGVVSRPWNGQPRNRGSIPKGQELFVLENLQTSAGAHTAPYPIHSGRIRWS